jgi:hypothetical protein
LGKLTPVWVIANPDNSHFPEDKNCNVKSEKQKKKKTAGVF